MKFDPKKPVSISNPLPQKQWPIKKGEAVYFLREDGVISGTVRWYNPARTIDVWATAGSPCYTVESCYGWNALVSDKNIRRKTPRGRRDLERMHIDRYAEQTLQMNQALMERVKREHQMRVAWCARWRRLWL
jgi:hypothetical protein